ncbi:hypothetical protein AB3Z07_21250 [Metabacillus halosaccharovorans]|uniref:hypothetical protein n=1 Tax=Metabacillus halosaccharovorans TaxID=930124 RepID=UPI0034CD12B4
MKYKYQSECIDDYCRTVILGTANKLDGIRCPRCNGPVLTEPYKPKPAQVSERGLLVKRKILERNLDFCKGATPDQVDTILKIGDEYHESKSNLKDIKCQINPETKKASNRIAEKLGLAGDNKTPLLKIELADINSVPTVIYKGEEIDKKIKVKFGWETDTFNQVNPTYLRIEHADLDSDTPSTMRIQYNQPIDSGDYTVVYADGMPIKVVEK